MQIGPAARGTGRETENADDGLQHQGERADAADRGEPRHAAALRACERSCLARATVRLRARAMRLLFGVARWGRGTFMPDADRRRRWPGRDHTRGARSLVCGATQARAGAGPASITTGLHRRAGAAVRLLRQRHADQRQRAVVAQSEPDGGGNPQCHGRPPVSLRDLSASPAGDSAGLPHHRGRDAMTATHDFARGPAAGDVPAALTRRNLLTGGGALIISFSIAGPASFAAAAEGTTAGPPDPSFIDSWIVVHDDSTATVFLGKCELGQGATTGLLQIVGEELDLDMSQLATVRLDTTITPNQGATTSSSSIHRGGPQIRAAAAEARQALLLLASTRL